MNNMSLFGMSLRLIASSDDKSWVSKYRDGLKRSLILTFVAIPLLSVLAITTKSAWISISVTYTVLLLLAAISGKRT